MERRSDIGGKYGFILYGREGAYALAIQRHN
jgi:hypothetical protein